MSETTLAIARNDRPVAFTQAELGWAPWLEPLSEEELTARHWAGLVDASRAKSTYFMLLARDPEILEARTKTDKDIFYNPAAGLPRAERELAAAAVSRDNGCIFCASVHARFASTYSKRREDMQRPGQGRHGRHRRPLERDHRRVGRAQSNAVRVRSPSRRSLAANRTRRPRHL
jgi:AhpD family alkylhydroperoxidase